MKSICWVFLDKQVRFSVNWLEHLVLKRIFIKKKYKIIKTKPEVKGESFNSVWVDEMGFIPKEAWSKIKFKGGIGGSDK